MERRVAGHNHKGQFDSVKYFEVPKNRLLEEEQRLVNELHPTLNRRPPLRTEVSRTTIHLTREDKKTIAKIQFRENLASTTAAIRWAINAVMKAK
jgi:hypothetical protein